MAKEVDVLICGGGSARLCAGGETAARARGQPGRRRAVPDRGAVRELRARGAAAHHISDFAVWGFDGSGSIRNTLCTPSSEPEASRFLNLVVA